MLTEGRPQLLATKILRPRPATGLIERQRLNELAAQVPEKQLAIIKAGAGFGKTSLALSWAQSLEENGHRVAWFSIDAEDNEPTHFLFYFTHALRHACAELGSEAVSLIGEGPLGLPQTIASALINDLTNVDDEVVLFLDDYHLLTDPEIHKVMSFFIKRAPYNFHLVLTTRSAPDLAVMKIRAQNQLLELDELALRFTLDETREFLDRAGLNQLEMRDVRALHAKTEGWPAILRIIACTKFSSTADLREFISGLSGSARPISLYLQEMLDGLPVDMVEFLLRTSILDRFSASLCAAVTTVQASGDLLESIEQRQLLLMPLDNEGRWYRYHPLLAGYLRERLEAEHGDEIAGLQLRAALWFAAQEMWAEAVQYAISAGDIKQAADWAEKAAMGLVKRGDMLTLLGWPLALGGQTRSKLAIAWGLTLAMRFDEALRLIGQIEADLDRPDQVTSDTLSSECDVIKSVVFALQDNTEQALAIAEACLAQGLKDPWNANVASNVARFGYWKAGDVRSFYATPWVPFSAEESKWNVFASVYRLCLEGLMEMDQARADRADQYYDEAMGLAEQHVGPNSVCATFPASLIALRHYHHGDLKAAEDLVIDRMPLIRAAGMLECVAPAYECLIKIAAYRNNIVHAFSLIEEAESLAEERGWGRLLAMTQLWRLRFFLDEGRVSEASACLDRLEKLEAAYPAPVRCAWTSIRLIAKLGRASMAVANNHLHEAIRLLTSARQEAIEAKQLHRALLIAVQLSTTLLQARDSVAAHRVFQDAMRAAAAGKMGQLVLDGGPQIGELLASFQDSPRNKPNPELISYAEELMMRWRQRYEPQAVEKDKLSVAELLSTRERNIISLIARGQSNKEVARDLGISPETVKSHMKHIFEKLAVEKRTQAVARAQSLGLVTA
ncbi:MAG: LuxR C-terminal-related transcriptional regulator [Xanthobacteraceae bacterium]